jgi:hypothetical protein
MIFSCQSSTCLISISANDSGKAVGPRNLVGIPLVGSILILIYKEHLNSIQNELISLPNKTNSIGIFTIFFIFF